MIFMTRSTDFEESFRKALGRDAKVLSCPLLKTAPVGRDQIATVDYDFLIFTSRMAVKHSARRIADKGLKCFAVGPGTAYELEQHGFPIVIDAGGTAEHLVQFVRQADFDRGLYLSGKDVTVDLSAQFPTRVDRLVVYETIPAQSLPRSVIHHLNSGKPWIAPFFSKKTYQSFEQLVRLAELQDSCLLGHAVAISDAVAGQFSVPWGSQTVVELPNAASMYAAIRAVA